MTRGLAFVLNRMALIATSETTASVIECMCCNIGEVYEEFGNLTHREDRETREETKLSSKVGEKDNPTVLQAGHVSRHPQLSKANLETDQVQSHVSIGTNGTVLVSLQELTNFL